MQKSQKAFTLLELVFVIAVIGILSAIAIPKFAMTRNDAIVTRGKATVGALRSAIATERQKRILRGNFDEIDGEEAEGLLEYGLDSSWSRNGDTFTFTSQDSKTCKFTVSSNKLVKGTCSVPDMSEL